LRSGDWIVPTLYGQPLLTKPPGMYVAIAATSWPFGGVSEGTARLPSALAATLLVLLFARAFGRNLGRGAALVAGLTLPASVLWLDRVPSAEIDMVQVAWVGAALLAFLRALELAEKRCEDPSPQPPPRSGEGEKELLAPPLRFGEGVGGRGLLPAR